MEESSIHNQRSVFILLIYGGIILNALGGTGNASSTHFHCDYFMCQYEKENIDAVILDNAGESQTVMFGEIHDRVLAEDSPPVEDSLYVISLLDKLKAIGYTHLALEVDESALPGTHSHEILRFLAEYNAGLSTPPESYPYAKPGWIALITAALQHQYHLIFINQPYGGMDRDAAMFHALQDKLFDQEPAAKVLVYIGANHIGESEPVGRFSSRRGRHKPLGYYLDHYTKGRNFSVYMGYPWDTPAGCDLFISPFIWNIFKKTIHTSNTPLKGAGQK